MKRDGTLPPNGLDDFLKLRSDDQTMRLFCENILSQVVGKNVWKEGVYHMKVSELASVTDEAFGLLALENIWDEWIGVSTEEFFGPRPRREANVRRVVQAGKYTGGWRQATCEPRNLSDYCRPGGCYRNRLFLSCCQ